MRLIESIRKQLYEDKIGADDALKLVERELVATQTAQLLILKGDLIQLSNGPEYELDDARACYLKAISIDPNDAEAYEELGHYFEISCNEELALKYYKEAIARGAGAECERYLAELEAELLEAEIEEI